MSKCKYSSLYIIGAFLGLLLTACDSQTVYYHYRHTSLNGWERNDTLSFLTEPIKQSGHYAEELTLRTTANYPFMSLQLVVVQKILPSQEQRTDTLNCSLIDAKGNTKGKGISHYQYHFPLATLPLREGDRLYIAIRHDMKREMLPGVSDIGIKISKEDTSRASRAHEVSAGINAQEDEEQERESP